MPIESQPPPQEPLQLPDPPNDPGGYKFSKKIPALSNDIGSLFTDAHANTSEEPARLKKRATRFIGFCKKISQIWRTPSNRKSPQEELNDYLAILKTPLTSTQQESLKTSDELNQLLENEGFDAGIYSEKEKENIFNNLIYSFSKSPGIVIQEPVIMLVEAVMPNKKGQPDEQMIFMRYACLVLNMPEDSERRATLLNDLPADFCTSNIQAQLNSMKKLPPINYETHTPYLNTNQMRLFEALLKTSQAQANHLHSYNRHLDPYIRGLTSSQAEEKILTQLIANFASITTELNSSTLGKLSTLKKKYKQLQESPIENLLEVYKQSLVKTPILDLLESGLEEIESLKNPYCFRDFLDANSYLTPFLTNDDGNADKRIEAYLTKLDTQFTSLNPVNKKEYYTTYLNLLLKVNDSSLKVRLVEQLPLQAFTSYTQERDYSDNIDGFLELVHHSSISSIDKVSIYKSLYDRLGNKIKDNAKNNNSCCTAINHHLTLLTSDPDLYDIEDINKLLDCILKKTLTADNSLMTGLKSFIQEKISDQDFGSDKKIELLNAIFDKFPHKEPIPINVLPIFEELAQSLPTMLSSNHEITDPEKLRLLSHIYARLSDDPAIQYLEKLTRERSFTDLIMSDESQPKPNVQELTEKVTASLKTTLDDLKAMALLQKNCLDMSRQTLKDKPNEQWKDSDTVTANSLILDPDQRVRIPESTLPQVRKASINKLKENLKEAKLNLPAQKLHDQILQNCVFTEEHTQQQEYLRAYNSLKDLQEKASWDESEMQTVRKALGLQKGDETTNDETQLKAWLQNQQLSEPNILEIDYNQNAVEANPILVLGQFCDVLNSQPNQVLRNVLGARNASALLRWTTNQLDDTLENVAGIDYLGISQDLVTQIFKTLTAKKEKLTTDEYEVIGKFYGLSMTKVPGELPTSDLLDEHEFEILGAQLIHKKEDWEANDKARAIAFITKKSTTVGPDLDTLSDTDLKKILGTVIEALDSKFGHIQAITKGLMSVNPKLDNLGSTSQELEERIQGRFDPTRIIVEKNEACTKEIEWFTKCMNDKNKPTDEKKDVLEFITSKRVSGEIQMVKSLESAGPSFKTHTCFNQLDIPDKTWFQDEYSKESFWSKLVEDARNAASSLEE